MSTYKSNPLKTSKLIDLIIYLFVIFITVVCVYQVVLLSVIIHEIDFRLSVAISYMILGVCSVIGIITKINAQVLFFFALYFSSLILFLIEHSFGSLTYLELADTKWYLTAAKSDNFWNSAEFSDWGFLSIMHFITSYTESITFKALQVLHWNVFCTVTSFFLIYHCLIKYYNLSLYKLRQISIITLYFPGLITTQLFILKEATFILLVTGALCGLLFLKNILLKLIITLPIVFFRPAYLAVVFMSYFPQKIGYTVMTILFAIVFLFFQNEILELVQWMIQISLWYFSNSRFEVFFNIPYALAFPIPDFSDGQSLQTYGYSHGSILYWGVLPFLAINFFNFSQNKSAKMIILMISMTMFVLNIGLFRAKIPLLAPYIFVLAEKSGFEKNKTLLQSVSIIFLVMLVLYLLGSTT